MDIIDPENEFMPIDEEKADYLIALAEDVRSIGTKSELTVVDGEILGVAANNMLILICQAMGGFDLYANFRQHAIALFTEATLMRCVIEKMSESFGMDGLGEMSFQGLEDFKSYMENNFEPDFDSLKQIENKIRNAVK